MPRKADHVQRRAQILDGLIRFAGHRGLHAVTMRAVAEESGVSLRLVQYYFGTKAALMNAALQRLEAHSHQRWNARLTELPDPAPPRRYLEAFLAEALPADEQSRTFHLVWTSYAVLAMTDPELAEQPFVAGPDHLEADLTSVLQQAQVDGALAADLDASLEAARLLTLNHGLGTSVLVGQRTPTEATAVLRYHLDHLFAHALHPRGTDAS